MAYIDWWNRTGPITMGERFGLNEISIARNTLSPTKSYTEDRIDMKPGGIVEPGVTNYGVATMDDPVYGIKKGDDLGTGISQGVYKGVQKKLTVGKYALKRGEGIRTYDRNPGNLEKLNKNVVLKKAGPKRTVTGWEHVTKLDSWNDFLNAEETFAKRTKIKKPAKFNKIWWEKLSKNERSNLIENYKNTFLLVKDKTLLKEISTLLGFKEKTLSAYYGVLNPRNLTDIEPGSVRFYRANQADRTFKLLEDIGIEAPERINDLYYVNKINKKQRVALEKIKKDKATLIENRIDSRTKREILINFSKASKEYIKGNYGAITNARSKLRALMNKAMAAMSESELRSYIKNNSVLLDMVENDVGVKGEIIRPKKIKDLTYDQLVNRASIEEDHIKPFEKAKVDPVTKQVLAGAGIHNPENIRLSTRMANSRLKRNATSFMDRTIDSTDSEIIENRKNMKNYIKTTGQGILEGPEWEGEIIGKKGEVSLLQQVKNLGIDTKTFFAKLPYVEQIQVARLLKCPLPIKGKAEGGRIGFEAGSGSMLACIDAKWEKDPKGFFRKTAGFASKGLDQLWKYAAPYWLPAVVVATGRLESFKHPTKPDMWWETLLASDAVKRLGLDKVQLSQLKNASLIKKADILGKLALSGGAFGDKILTQAAKVAKPLVIATETLSAVKGIKSELDLVKEYASKNNIPYEKARLAYYASGAALKPRWEGDKSFKSWAFSKLTGGANLYALALEKRKDSEFQNIGTEIFEYINKYKPEPVEEEKVPEKGEIPSGLDWALNVEAQMKKKEPQKYAAVDSFSDSFSMGGIASLIK